MRRFSLTATVLFLVSAAPVQAQQWTPEQEKVIDANHVDVSLLGRWESVAVSRGGIGTMFEFREDGTMFQSEGVLVDLWIRSLTNTELVLYEKDGEGEETRLEFAIEGYTALVNLGRR